MRKNMSFKIINATTAHYRFIHENLQRHQYQWSIDDLVELSNSPNGISRVCLSHQNEIMGFYLASRVVDQLTLLLIFVDPLQRRCGVGLLLMRDLLVQAGEHNCSEVQLEVRQNNLAARELYLRVGFDIVGERKNYYPPINSLSSQSADRENAVLYSYFIQNME